jgi:PKD repeat protein
MVIYSVMNGNIENRLLKKGVNRIQLVCFVILMTINFVLMLVLGGCNTNKNTGDIEPPGEIISPKVVLVNPSNAATDVPINTSITAIFSGSMDPATINTSTFILDDGTTIINGQLTYDDSRKAALFDPDSELAVSTPYTVIITTGVKDAAGNPLDADYIWTFTTGMVPDLKAPTVDSTYPLNAAAGVYIITNIAATFSESMDPTTINTSTFNLTYDTADIDGQLTYEDSSKTAFFYPDSDLELLTNYTARITTGVKDVAGNPLDTDYTFSFVTSSVGPPVADFSADAPSGNARHTVAFTDQSLGSITWEWDFDNDGFVDSTVQNPTYVYYHAGLYEVKLKVTGPGGPPDEMVKSDYINVDIGSPVEHTLDNDFFGAQSVYTADIDGDGDTDVIGAAYNADTITWWENTSGDGSSWTGQTIDNTFDGACSVITADVDGDGDIDALGAASLDDEITWWENTSGDGSAWTEYTVGSNFDGARSVYTEDIDGDGDIDVLGAAYDADTITWWENTSGDGSSWTEHAVDSNFDGARSVYTADIDGDGDIDVLGAAYDADTIIWWENTSGDGSTWTEHTVDNTFDGAISVDTADVDGDGDIDVLGAAYDADTITWWENTSADGSMWTDHIVDNALDGAISVDTADVDGDGDIDVLGAAYDADTITWWENTSVDGSTWIEHTVDNTFDGANSVHASDVDGDGDVDILGAASTANSITWWMIIQNNDNQSDISIPIEYPVESNFGVACSVYPVDVDGDGDVDVLGAALATGDIAWWENASVDGSTWIEHTVDGTFVGAISVHAADVDGDGDIDVLGAASIDDDITWWENTSGDGSIWAEHTVDNTFDGAQSVHTADVDGDGDIDVLGAASIDDDITWWENTSGDGSIWAEHTIDDTFDVAISVSAFDIDKDGDIDVLGAAMVAGDITWWENSAGDGSAWTEHTIDDSFDGAQSVYAADVDGDGDIDVLGAATDADDIIWWENSAGDGSAWIGHTINDSFYGARSVHAADVDGDGDIDVLGAAYDADTITWWENTTGDGNSWKEHTVDNTFDGAQSVHAADVDGDGDIDILAAASSANTITWWEIIR